MAPRRKSKTKSRRKSSTGKRGATTRPVIIRSAGSSVPPKSHTGEMSLIAVIVIILIIVGVVMSLDNDTARSILPEGVANALGFTTTLAPTTKAAKWWLFSIPGAILVGVLIWFFFFKGKGETEDAALFRMQREAKTEAKLAQQKARVANWNPLTDEQFEGQDEYLDDRTKDIEHLK